MNSPLRAQPIWSTNLFFRNWEEHAQEAPALIDYLYQIKGQEREAIASGVARSAKPAQGLFESKFNLFATGHPSLRRLIAFIGDSLVQAINQVHGTPDARNVRVSAVESWFHITNDGGFHDSHHHHGCSWCGIYYVQAGDPPDTAPGASAGNGINRFYSPLMIGGGYFDAGSEYLRKTSTFDITPHDGMLMLFPSYLMHSALAYRGKKDRIVISFNSQATRG